MISKKTLVVILNYNHYKNTKQCVESLISSNDIGNDFLIVIVDNCSKNESFEILKKYFYKKDFIKVIKTDHNGGYSYGNNFGILYAKKYYEFKYIAIVNPDVTFNSDVFGVLIPKLESNDKISMISCGVIFQNKFNILNQSWNIPSVKQLILQHSLLSKKLPTRFSYPVLGETLFETELLPGSFFIIKDNVFSEVGYFDDNIFMYNEEIALGIKIKNIGMIAALDLSVCYYHNHKCLSKKDILLKYKYKFKNVKDEYNVTYDSRKYVCKRYYQGKGLFRLSLINFMNKIILVFKHWVAIFLVK